MGGHFGIVGAVVLAWVRILLGREEWTWQYPELHPDQLRVVTRLNQTEEIYSPQVVVKD